MGLLVFTSANNGTEIFCGSYSAFNRFRQIVCKAIGGSWPPHFIEKNGEIVGTDTSLDRNMWYLEDDFNENDWPGLWLFLNHSDCEGKFSPKEARLVARDLEKILPKIAELKDVCPSRGHLERNGGYYSVTKKFIEGCRIASKGRCIVSFG